MNDTDRATCAALAGLLRAAGVLALWGFALSAIAALVLALTLRSLPTTPSMAFGAVAILGVLERYFAFRLRLDQALFDDLARGGRSVVGAQSEPRQLLQRHAIVVACQSAMFLLALMTQDLT
ncbi:hypothetical protein ACEN8K_27890 [Variovorax sp. CT11-76]